jgi:ferredoxin-nitrite reductase
MTLAPARDLVGDLLARQLLPFQHPYKPYSKKEMVQDHGFTEEQKQYLEGFITAIAKKRGLGMPAVSASTPGNAQIAINSPGKEQKSDPVYIHVEAQNRATRTGGQLVPEEFAKREKHPFDMWDEMLANAEGKRFPKGLDVFRYKFHGLFYVAPNQNAFMLRLRIPGGILSADHARGFV